MAKIKFRRDTAATWTEVNPTLAQGEPGFEYDTGLFKIGDGETAWADLTYSSSSGDAASLTDEGGVTITAGSTEHWVATQRRDNQDSRGKGVRYDSNGNLYTLVYSYADNSDDLAVITKYTPAGAVSWQKTIEDAQPMSLAIDSADCAYIAINYNGPLNLIKFDTDGTVLWKKEYTQNLSGIFDAFIEEKSSSSIIVACNRETEGPSSAVVLDINSATGAINTQREIKQDGQGVYVAGIDVAGSYVYVSGKYYDVTVDQDKMYVTKLLATNLTEVWTKSIESPNTYDMSGGDCASDATGNIYVAGYYNVQIVNINGTSNETVGILTKLNSSGAVQWTRRLGPGPCGIAVAGLTATSTGDVYLATATFEYNRRDRNLGEEDQWGLGVNKLVVVKFNTSGTVLWQRYVDSPQLAEWNDSFRGQAVAVYDNKFAVDGYGESWNNTEEESDGNSADAEQDYFVLQLPTDGTELTLGKIDFIESRIPGRNITLETTTPSSVVHQAWAETVAVANSALTLDTAARIANDLVKTEAYEYTFGANGTLTIPNDGDVKLTQTQVGFLIALGTTAGDGGSIYGRTVVADSQGNVYIAGEDDSYQPFVMKFDPEGFRLWGVSINEDSEGYDGRANGLSIDPTTGNIVVTIELYGSYDYSETVTLDQDTGRIISAVEYTDADSNVLLVDIAHFSNGSFVSVGSKDGEFSPEYPAVPQTGSGVGVITVLRSAIPNPNAGTYWTIGGDGIDPFENVASVNDYTAISGTVRQGSGATFNVTDLGDGTYSAAIVNGGTNYRIGHKIKILGSAIGGADGTNDIIITVTGWNQTGVITGVSNSGTAAGTESATYSGLSGTNYNVGSGLSLNYSGPISTSNYDDQRDWGFASAGSNYAVDDVITISGTALGGASPANDMTVVVTAVDAGSVTGVSFAGTSQTTYWKLTTTTQVNFLTADGPWTIKYATSRENYMTTSEWSRVFGTNTGNNTDRLYAVSIDSGNNIITVGEGYGELYAGYSDSLAMVYKFNSAGTLQWSRKLNEVDYIATAMSVATIGTDIYTTHYSPGPGWTVVTKLSANGTVQWQRYTDSSDDSIIAATEDGNILVAIESYNSSIDYNAIKIVKMTPSGETIFKRWLYLGTDNATNFKNGRGLVVQGDSFYISAYFIGNNSRPTLLARLPVDGTGVGEYGAFRYVDVNDATSNWYGTGLTGINYDITLVDPQETYAGALASDPYVNTTPGVTVTPSDNVPYDGLLYVGNFDPSREVEVVRDTDGGRIVFADGTTQSSSAQDIPQRIWNGQKYTLGLEDRGHHIYCRGNGDHISIPYDSRVEFPIGTVITIVNYSGGDVYIGVEGGSTGLVLTGVDEAPFGVLLSNLGMATLLKVEKERWFISGNLEITGP